MSYPQTLRIPYLLGESEIKLLASIKVRFLEFGVWFEFQTAVFAESPETRVVRIGLFKETLCKKVLSTVDSKFFAIWIISTACIVAFGQKK